MTKYEWEKELKRNLSRLPIDEQNRAISYYDELFADKAEQGYSEREVVREFGNPFDVANAIIRDYESEHGRAAPQPAPQYRVTPAAPQPDRFDPDTGAPVSAPQSRAKQERMYSEREMRRARRGGFLGAVLRVLFFIPYVVMSIVMGALILAFGISAVACVAGGIAYAFMAFWTISASGAVFAAELAMGLACVGVGAIFMVLVPILSKVFKRVSAAYLGIKRREVN